MKAFRTISLFFILSLIPIGAFSASIQLAGIVPEQIDLSYSENLNLVANGDFAIEAINLAGQKERHYLQYNKGINFPKKKIKKIIIYAP